MQLNIYLKGLCRLGVIVLDDDVKHLSGTTSVILWADTTLVSDAYSYTQTVLMLSISSVDVLACTT